MTTPSTSPRIEGTDTPAPAPEIRVSSFPFKAEQVGQKWMLAIKPDGGTLIDGGHSTKADVVKAKVLHESISMIRPPEGTRYFMVTIEALPGGKPRLDQSVIKTLNSLPR